MPQPSSSLGFFVLLVVAVLTGGCASGDAGAPLASARIPEAGSTAQLRPGDSLTVALQGRDYDTGLNVVDGKTHRVTVGWDSATGRLAVYDNGVLVRSFADVSKGVEIKGGGSMVYWIHKEGR